MLDHKSIADLLASYTAEAARLTEYRQSTAATVVRLSDDMAAALGSPNGYRRLTPFLATITETVANKLEIDEAKLKASKVRDSKQIATWLGDDKWSVTEKELWRAASRDGRAYILVRWVDGPDYTVRECFDGTNGAGSVKENGETKFTFNAWKAGDYFYIDLYFPDRIEKYARQAEKKWEPRKDSSDEEWPLPWVDDSGEPLGIALVEYSICQSDVDNAVQVGRDLQESVLDLVATSRLQGFPQRWLRGQKNPHVLLNETGQPLVSPITGKPFPRTVQAAPGSIMLIGAEAELGQLDAHKADSGPIDKLLELLSLITTVPTHYFTGQWPSGIALLQAESRLNHKIEAHQARLTSSVVVMLRLTMRLSNLFGGTAFDPDQDLTIPWYSPQIETEDLRIEREKATTENVTALFGAKLMSRFIALKAIHTDWSDDEINQEIGRLDAERSAPIIPPVDPSTGVSTNALNANQP